MSSNGPGSGARPPDNEAEPHPLTGIAGGGGTVATLPMPDATAPVSNVTKQSCARADRSWARNGGNAARFRRFSLISRMGCTGCRAGKGSGGANTGENHHGERSSRRKEGGGRKTWWSERALRAARRRRGNGSLGELAPPAGRPNGGGTVSWAALSGGSRGGGLWGRFGRRGVSGRPGGRRSGGCIRRRGCRGSCGRSA